MFSITIYCNYGTGFTESTEGDVKLPELLSVFYVDYGVLRVNVDPAAALFHRIMPKRATETPVQCIRCRDKF